MNNDDITPVDGRRPRPRSLSQHDIEEIADAVAERAGSHQLARPTSTPPAIRWLQKAWWKLTLWALVVVAGAKLVSMIDHITWK